MLDGVFGEFCGGGGGGGGESLGESRRERRIHEELCLVANDARVGY